MRAEALRHRWVVLLLGAALFSTGCATLPPPPGGSGSLSALRETAAGTPPLQTSSSLTSTGPDGQERLHRRHNERLLASDVALVRPQPSTQGPPTCGGEAVPEGWPDYSSWWDEELLAPFFKCTSPAELLALQRRVDMPRLLEALNDWPAVRLGALGPMEDARASRVLQRKRFSFLVNAPRKYGAYDQVFSLFVVDTSFDDELRELLLLLAKDKQLEQTLGRMEAAREALERRGFKLSDYRDREEQPGDVWRGLGRAADDVASSIPVVEGARAGSVFSMRAQLPPPYQEAFDETERALTREHFAPGHVALGSFDSLTFGVPLGFYYLAAGTGHGAYSLTQGQYEQATRELAPAALLVGLYVGGKGVRYFSEARGGAGAGERGVRLLVPEPRLRALKEVVERLRERLGEEGFGQLARYIQADREVAVLVGAGGEPAAVAIYEARGNVARAQAVLSQARPEPASPTRTLAGAGKSPGNGASVAREAAGTTPERAGAGRASGTLASLVDKGVGHTLEVVEAKLAAAELEATGPRLPMDVGVLEKHRPSLAASPPEVRDSPRWREYVDYYEKRLSEVKKGTAAEGPLKWDGYERMRGWFARGLAFERTMVQLLREDAKKPRAERRFLGDFDRPRIETQVGVRKPDAGLRYADVLVLEEGELGGRPRRVETFSFKSRDLSGLKYDALKAQMIADAKEALDKYSERLEIRRSSLQSLLPGGSEVQVSRVRLIYEGGALKPTNADNLKAAVSGTKREVPGVEVLFQ